MKRFLTITLALMGLITQQSLATDEQKGWLDRLKEKLEEAQRQLEESRRTSSQSTGKETGSWYERLFGMGKKEEQKPTQYEERKTTAQPTSLEQLLGLGKKEEPKPKQYEEQPSKTTSPSWLEQLFGLGQKEATRPAPQPTRTQDFRRSEEYESAVERAKRQAPDWLEKAKQYLGLDQKEQQRP